MPSQTRGSLLWSGVSLGFSPDRSACYVAVHSTVAQLSGPPELLLVYACPSCSYTCTAALALSQRA